MNWRLVAAWVVALLVTTGVTWQIVNFADSRVSAQPLAVAPAAPTTSPKSTTSSSPGVITTTASIPTTSVTSETSETNTSGSPAPSSAPSTSDAAAVWSLRTITSAGGTVVVRYRPGEVTLQAATPAPGFDVEVDEPGPPRVRVGFEDDDGDIRVEVRWEDGGLDIEISGDA